MLDPAANGSRRAAGVRRGRYLREHKRSERQQRQCLMFTWSTPQSALAIRRFGVDRRPGQRQAPKAPLASTLWELHHVVSAAMHMTLAPPVGAAGFAVAASTLRIRPAQRTSGAGGQAFYGRKAGGLGRARKPLAERMSQAHASNARRGGASGVVASGRAYGGGGVRSRVRRWSSPVARTGWLSPGACSARLSPVARRAWFGL